MTITLIETKTLGTAAASIEFVSIPQDGTDLVLLWSGRNSIENIEWYMRFNSDTGSNYTVRRLRGNGATVASSTNTLTGLLFQGLNPSTYTANTFGNAAVYIPNYTGSTEKSVSCDEVVENNATTAFQTITAGLWTGTVAITTLSIVAAPGSDTFVAGSTASLYKITKGSDGIVTTS
jgi:hypothetical protein